MVLLFISSILCPLVMSAGQIFCVRSVLVHACVCASVKHFYPWALERKRPSVTKNKVMSEVSPGRSSVFGSLCWLLVKQASSLIWHLDRGYTLFVCPFFIFVSSFLKFRNTSWMCMEKWETYGLCGQTHCPPESTQMLLFTQILTHIFSTDTQIICTYTQNR